MSTILVRLKSLKTKSRRTDDIRNIFYKTRSLFPAWKCWERGVGMLWSGMQGGNIWEYATCYWNVHRNVEWMWTEISILVKCEKKLNFLIELSRKSHAIELSICLWRNASCMLLEQGRRNISYKITPVYIYKIGNIKTNPSSYMTGFKKSINSILKRNVQQNLTSKIYVNNFRNIYLYMNSKILHISALSWFDPTCMVWLDWL